MDSAIKSLEDVLTNIVKIYEQLLEINEIERGHLVNAEVVDLSKTVEIKKYLALKVRDMEARIKKILDKYHVLKVGEFISLVNNHYGAGELKRLERKAKFVMGKYREKEKLNRIIATEHMSFYRSMIDMYAAVVHNDNRNYKENASIENINYNRMNVRV